MDCAMNMGCVVVLWNRDLISGMLTQIHAPDMPMKQCLEKWHHLASPDEPSRGFPADGTRMYGSLNPSLAVNWSCHKPRFSAAGLSSRGLPVPHFTERQAHLPQLPRQVIELSTLDHR